MSEVPEELDDADVGDAREPVAPVEAGNDDEEDEEGLVPLGDVLVALDAERKAAAQETAADLLRRNRAPPNAMDAERAVLGACLMDGGDHVDEAVAAGLAPSSFYRPAHGIIFKVIVDLRAGNEPVDTLTVVDELLLRGELDGVGGAAAISQLEALLPTAAHVGAYAKLVRDKATLRTLIKTCSATVASAFAQDRQVDELLAEHRADVMALEGKGSTGIRSMKEIVAAAMKTIPGLGGVRRCTPTGFGALDSVLGGGLTPGELIIVAGRPSMGKTQWVLDVANHIAVEKRQRVHFASLEMDDEDLAKRLGGVRAQVSTRAATLKPEEQSRLQLEMERISYAPIEIDQRPGQSLAHVRRNATASAVDGDLAIVIIDYLQLMLTAAEEGGRFLSDDNKASLIGDVTKGLKQLARDLQVPVVCLSQLNRGVESRPNKRPMMSDLRESGAIEQDADAILFFYREEYYLREATPADKVGAAEIIVAKQRNGPAGLTINARFEGNPPHFS